MSTQSAQAKVPAITMGFWIVKILATTLGETGGDAVSMTWLGETTNAATGWGYLIGTAIFVVPLAVLVSAQIRVQNFKPWLYWATIIASTTAGTTMADFATRSLGIGYPGGSLLLLTAVMGCLFAWQRTLGSIDVGSVTTPRAEAYYWATITFSQTLGTALGDWVSDSGPGYLGAALIFAAALALVALLWFRTPANKAVLFWAAFILTRPLGATVGDFLDKPLDHGGLGMDRPIATAILAGLILVLIWMLPQRAAEHPKG